MFPGVLDNRDFSHEFIFKSSRSSGAGGQNVNKVNTKVELRFHVDSSMLLNNEEKEIIKRKLSAAISSEGYIIIVTQTKRSQIQNKEIAIEKFYRLINKTLIPEKKRKPTKPTTASKEKRLTEKRIRSEKKTLRKKNDI